MSFDVFDIAASGMHAQRVKMDTISSNIANANTTRRPDGSLGPYIKKEVSFSAIYNKKLSQGMSNFSAPSNSASAHFDPGSGTMVLNGGISTNEGQVAKGVQIDRIVNGNNPIKTIYDPSNPDANADGFVQLPNINVVEEMVGMVTASKAYEANSVCAENAKTMINAAMKI